MKFQVTKELEELIDDFVSLTSGKITIASDTNKRNKITIPIKGTLTFDFASGTRTFDVTPITSPKRIKSKNKRKSS